MSDTTPATQPDGTPWVTGTARNRRPSIRTQAKWALGAIAGLILLIVLLAHIPSGTSSGASVSTPQQAAQALIGTSAHTQLTGSDLGTIKAAVPDGPFTSVPGNGRQFRCDITLSSGETVTAKVTVWSDGSIGWQQT